MIELQHIDKIYDTGQIRLHAIKDLSLTIAGKEFAAFCGPSGSGKTTLLNILGTLDTATSGKYLFDGADVSAMNKKERVLFRRRTLGFVFQNFNLIPELDVYENVEVPLLVLKDKHRRERILEAIECVGLGKHLRHRPAQLSGGQQQRVSIARAIVKNPALILADEPTANLDRATSREILGVLSTLRERYHPTIVLCTHDTQLLESVDRSIQIVDGSIG